jgi:hypothetical protein
MQNMYPDYQGYQGDQAYQGFQGNQAYQGFPEYADNKENKPYLLPQATLPLYDENQPYQLPQATLPLYEENQPNQLPLTSCPSCEKSRPCDFSPIGVAGHFCNEALVRIIQECQATCEYATTHLKRKSDCRGRRNQLILLRDCADICGDTAKFVARGSDFDREKALLCARICECCGQECARFCDRISQHCAEICFFCAKACRAFAQGY